MDFIIKETGEHRELCLPRKGESDICGEIIGDSGAIGDYIFYDDETYRYHINQENFNWWTEYIHDLQKDLEELDQLYEKYGEKDVDEIIRREPNWYGRDYDTHHSVAQQVYEQIREALGE